MRLLKKILLGIFSALFLLSLSSAAFADPFGEEDPVNPPTILPDNE